MNRLVRTLAAAALGFAAASIYRQWRDSGRAGALPRRHHLETWENEGGALTTPVSSEGVRRTPEATMY
jgi:hypothetical protein